MATPSSRAQASSVRACGTTSVRPGIVPANTSPEAPSTVIVSPSRSVRPPIAISPSPTRSPAAPTTAGMPQPRATTAA